VNQIVPLLDRKHCGSNFASLNTSDGFTGNSAIVEAKLTIIESALPDVKQVLGNLSKIEVLSKGLDMSAFEGIYRILSQQNFPNSIVTITS
jgi:hypothetical protein